MQRTNIHKAKSDKIYDAVAYIILTLILLVMAYPLYFIICASISDPDMVSAGKMVLYPVDMNLLGYKKILDYAVIWIGYRNTFIYTVLGTIISVTLTITLAYPLSRKDFKLRGPLMVMITITMFFSGGMIPTYLTVSKLGMLNTIWAVIIPGAIGTTNVIITRTFFQTSIPNEIIEAASIDGCTNFKAFTNVVLPLSKAIIAVIALYYASGLWNSYFDPMIYLTDRDKYPLQLFLRQILIINDFEGADLDASSFKDQRYISELMKYGIIIVSTLPMMVLYPFIQKYFVKGVMIGSLKG